MLELHVMCHDEIDGYKANTEVCEFFKGLKAFINDDIIVTVVKPESIAKPDGSSTTMWSFDICFVDSNVDRRIVISAGEIGIQGVKRLWAFNKVEDYVNGKDLTE